MWCTCKCTSQINSLIGALTLRRSTTKKRWTSWTERKMRRNLEKRRRNQLVTVVHILQHTVLRGLDWRCDDKKKTAITHDPRWNAEKKCCCKLLRRQQLFCLSRLAVSRAEEWVNRNASIHLPSRVRGGKRRDIFTFFLLKNCCCCISALHLTTANYGTAETGGKNVLHTYSRMKCNSGLSAYRVPQDQSDQHHFVRHMTLERSKNNFSQKSSDVVKCNQSQSKMAIVQANKNKKRHCQRRQKNIKV